MRRTPVLFKQNIGFHFEKHWAVQAKRRPIQTSAEKVLKEKGVAIYDPIDLLKEVKTFEKIEVIGFKEKPVAFDKTHPDWHDEKLLTFKDNDVLLEGLMQSKILTNTIELKTGLPDSHGLKSLPKGVNKFAKQAVMNAQIFDAEQEKLPKLKDPKRPAWNFPRVFGVTQKRRNTLTIMKLLQLIESYSDKNIVQQRYLFNDLLFSFPFERRGSQIQFRLTGDTLLTTSSLLAPVTQESTADVSLPDIYPIEPTITLGMENIYKIERIYPIKSNIKKSVPHTLFVHFDREVVKNLYEEEVTEDQIYGRSLLKAFTAAATFARQKYGEDVKEIPESVTIQVVQTDAQFFHFGVFQLNTLDLEGGNTKNIWYQTPLEYLFESCAYNLGKPELEGYNSDVVKQLYSFYNQV